MPLNDPSELLQGCNVTTLLFIGKVQIQSFTGGMTVQERREHWPIRADLFILGGSNDTDSAMLRARTEVLHVLNALFPKH